MKNKIRGVALVLGLLCTGCAAQTTTEQALPQGTAVETYTLSAGAMQTQYALTGKVAAKNAVQVFPMLAGKVTGLYVSEGDTVSAGQTLFTVDTSTVTSSADALAQSYQATKQLTDSTIASAQVGVEQADLGIAQAELALEQAQTALDNARALFEVGAAAAQDVTRAEQGLTQAQSAKKQAETAKLQAQNGLAQAKAQQAASLAQIQASIDQIATQASLGTVTAPVGGTVTMVTLTRGGMAGQAQPAVVIAENGTVEVQASVSEEIYAVLRQGDTVQVDIPVLGDTPVQGVLQALPPTANAQTSLYDLKIALPQGVQPTIGTFVTVTFVTAQRDNVLSVPTEALMTGDNEERYLFTVDAQGEYAQRVSVEVGLVGEEQTEIVSGLTEGARVVIKGQSYLADGDMVRVVGQSGANASDEEG